MYFAPRGGGRETAGYNSPGGFSCFFIIHYYYFPFFRGHLPQTPGFRSARQILAASSATQARTCISSDLNIFYTPWGGRTTKGSNAPGSFLVTPP